MIRISSLQQNALDPPFPSAAFVRRVATYMREHFPQLRSVQLEPLNAEIASQSLVAQKFGLETEQDTVSYILAAYVLGADFHEHPEIQDYLTSDRPSLDKAMFLDAVVLATDEQEQSA